MIVNIYGTMLKSCSPKKIIIVSSMLSNLSNITVFGDVTKAFWEHYTMDL